MDTSLAWRGGREFTGGESDPVLQLACVPGLYPLAGGSLSHNRHAANKAVGQHPPIDRKSEAKAVRRFSPRLLTWGFPVVHIRGDRSDGRRSSARRPAAFRPPAGRPRSAGTSAHAPGARRSAVTRSRPFSEAGTGPAALPPRTAAGPVLPAVGLRPRDA